MIYMYWSAGAKDALDGRTVFSKPGGGTRIGEKLAGLPLSLRSDPAAPGLQCAPFVIAHASSRESSVFDNGLPKSRTDWIAGGTLAALTQTRHTAQLMGQPVTPAIDNLILDAPGADGSIAELVGRTSRGLLLTCLWYIREVDPQTLLLTGLTRDGVYLVENGEVTGAVNNFRFNESPVGMLSRITEVGGTVPTLPREWARLLHQGGHAADPGRGVQHVLGEPGQLGRGPPRTGRPVGGLGVLEPESDLEADLVVGHLAVDDLAADLRHLEPVEVTQCLRGPQYGAPDRRLDALGRGADDLGDAISTVGHAVLLVRGRRCQVILIAG